VDGTAVLETTFVTAAGSARVFDCLPVVDGIAQLRPARKVLRVVEGVSGTVQFQAHLQPRPGYARIEPRLMLRGRLGWSYAWRNEALHVGTDVDMAAEGTALAGAFDVGALLQPVLRP